MLSRLRKKFRESKQYKFMDSHIKISFTFVVLLTLLLLYVFCEIEKPIESIVLNVLIIGSSVVGLFGIIHIIISIFKNDALFFPYENEDKNFILLCCVIILIIVFATLYVLITVFDCDAFNIGCKFNNVFDKMINMLYFSTMTLTTVGYGDIAPVSNLAKIVVSIESLIFTVIISFIIMNFKPKTNENEEKDAHQNEENNNE